MSVVGIILACVLLAVLGYLIFRNVKGIIEGIKARKQAKLEKEKQEKTVNIEVNENDKK